MAQTVNDALNDFGFTFVDEEQIAGSSNTVNTLVESQYNIQTRLDNVMKLITPFLKNLQANPTQAYMKWPDRAAKVAEFEKKIIAVAEGKVVS